MFPANFRNKLIQAVGAGNIYRYYPLDEPSNTTAYDISSYKTNGTYDGATLVDDITPFGDPTPTFDGVNDDVTCDSNLTTHIGQYNKGTFIAYVNPDSSVPAETVYRSCIAVSDGPFSNNNIVTFAKTSTANLFRLIIRLNTGSYQTRDATWTTAGWRQIVISWDTAGDTTARFWVNDTKLSDHTLSDTWTSNTTAYRIGTFNGTEWYGSIAHCVLLSTQITDTNLVAYLARESGVI